MEQDKFILTVIDFIERGILPKVKSDNLRWIGGGLLPMVCPLLARKINDVSGMFKMVGIMDDDGHISVDNTKKFMDGAFQQQPELRVEIASLLPKECPEIVRDWLEGVAVKLSSQDASDFIAMLNERS